MKEVRKSESKKVYLKKGYHTFNDIYYNIFLDTDGRYYFSFVNNRGLTVLLNTTDHGYTSLLDAENAVNEVLSFAKQKNNFEIKTAKDGKFFLHLLNDKNEVIARSFFFRTKEEIQQTLKEFVSGTATTSHITHKNTVATQKQKSSRGEIIPISEKAISEKKILEENALAKAKWEEEKKQRQLEKEKNEKERVILLAAKKKKRAEEKSRKENERSLATQSAVTRNPMKDDDLFDGCFRWLWIILALLFLAVIFSYFKGCFGNLGKSGVTMEEDQAELQSLTDDPETKQLNSGTNSSLESDNTTESIDQETNDSPSETIVGSSTTDLTDSKETTNKNHSSNNKGSVLSNGYENIIQAIADCGCSSKADIFIIPTSDAKLIKKLGTNPQFGNTHGLSAADFMEELKYNYKNDSWDRKYLNYLYKAMGYNGFQDAKASQFSQEKLNPNSKGILGFGTYSGYAYSELALKGKDLEVFRIEAANGCHINFMKTCGNLFFMCE